jgi:CDP-paratose 2-epimerase
MLMAEEQIATTQGQVFNVGGGAKNSISIWQEFEPILTKAIGQPVHVTMGDWRPGDQKVCIMNTNRIQKTLGWSPKVSIEQGMGIMAQWVKDNLEIL